MNAPVPFTWNGDVMTPPGRFLRLCDKQFAVGETYPLVVHEDRSTNSHNHFFAAVHEAWKNLPERLTQRYPTSEHLRKWALIKAGYADERSIACTTAEEALRVAAFLKPMDDYAIVVVADATIKVFTAKSQSARAMDKATFQESKQSVLDIVAEMIGVDPKTLTAHSTEQNSRSSAPADAGGDQVQASASTNPPEALPRAPQPQAEPAPEISSPKNDPGAGATTSPSPPAEHQVSGGDPAQATESGNHAQDGSAGLPVGWEKLYSEKLSDAKAPRYLPGIANKFWSAVGGWEKHKSGPNASTAKAIYDAHVDHFGDAGREARETILHELSAI